MALNDLSKGQLVKKTSGLMSKNRTLREQLASPATAAANGAVTLAGSAIAGMVDGRGIQLPIGAGLEPSATVGIASGIAGFFTGSPMLVQLGTGMLAPHVYNNLKARSGGQS
jgi:hypothetical protein